MRTWHRQIAAVALLAAGIGLYCAVIQTYSGNKLLLGLGAILALSTISPLSNRFAAAYDRLDRWLQQRP